VLSSLLAHRAERAAEIGYETTEHGAWVDWDALEHSWLSSTERAAVVVARGIAMAEHEGGWPPDHGPPGRRHQGGPKTLTDLRIAGQSSSSND
jgi:hypothetical protein